jgi:hypothetical protein
MCARAGQQFASFSEADIQAVTFAAPSLKPELRAVTYRTLVGLLFVTGARVAGVVDPGPAQPTAPRPWVGNAQAVAQ